MCKQTMAVMTVESLTPGVRCGEGEKVISIEPDRLVNDVTFVKLN